MKTKKGESIVTKIKEIRQELNISRYRLSKDTHISYIALMNIEKGGDIKLSNLYKIAKALGVPAEKLLKEENNND